MTDKPWESEPDELDFEAEGLPCAMRRGAGGAWCGYVGVGPDHPLFGLPTDHMLKLPMAWFEGRRGLEGAGAFEFLLHALGERRRLDEGCSIGLALQVHGGVNYAHGTIQGREAGDRWWFGFDCGHARDYLPGITITPKAIKSIVADLVEAMQMPEGRAAEIMRAMMGDPAKYRDQQYVVGECQALAAQLNAIVGVLGAQPAATERGES
jgi:hypothetical protein